MFKDILGPINNDDDVKQDPDDHGPLDDKQPQGTCSWDCECDGCLEEAIKDLADQIGFDLESEDIENIKIEYNDKKKNN